MVVPRLNLFLLNAAYRLLTFKLFDYNLKYYSNLNYTDVAQPFHSSFDYHSLPTIQHSLQFSDTGRLLPLVLNKEQGGRGNP